MLLSRFNNENLSTIEIGIDEAGRGSFWGPIMAGALIIPPEVEWNEKQKQLFEQLRDSKKISPKKREILYNAINECITQKGIGIVMPDEINNNGISWANQEAFRRAIKMIQNIIPNNCVLLIDGVLPISDWNGSQELIIQGDGKYLAIAGASILAKVSHDRWIIDYCKNNTECSMKYDLENSKGYGTLKHRDGIKVYGGHELHRILYIQNWLPDAKQNINTKCNTNVKTLKGTEDDDNTCKETERNTTIRHNYEEKCLIKFC
jgi:ribonuclease HII